MPMSQATLSTHSADPVRTRLRRVLSLWLLLTLGFAANAYAQTPLRLDATTETGATRFVLPLSKFAPRPGALRLIDQSGGVEFAIPISSRVEIESAAINIRITSSLALSPQISALSIIFNDVTLGQVRLNATTPTSVVRAPIPRELIKPGFNELRLAAVQSTGAECEDPESPALWSELDTVNSSIELVTRLRRSAFRLSELDQVFTPGIGGATMVTILSPAGQNAPQYLNAGTMVAQAIALRTQYEPIDIRSATWTAPTTDSPQADPLAAYGQQDVVVIGTAAELARVVPGFEAAEVAGPRIGLRTLPNGRVRVLISGRTEQELMTAAEGLALFDVPVTDAFDTQVTAITREKDRPLGGERAMRANWTYRFDDLGLATQVVNGLGIHEKFLDLPLPPDLYTHESAQAKLSLDFSYGAAMGPGSVLNVLLNGKFMHGISLNNESGANFRGYEIFLPFRDFVAGANRLTFSMHMRVPSSSGGTCSGARGRHLAMTLFGSSQLSLPPASNVAAQPDLDLFARTAFPYFKPDQTTPVQILVADSSLIGAGWMLAGRLAQVVRAPLKDVSVQVGVTPKPGFAFIIAPTGRLSADLFKQVNFGLGQNKRVPYRAFAPPVGTPSPSLADELLAFIWSRPSQQSAQRPATGFVEQSASLGRNGVMISFASAGASGTTTVVTSEDSAQLSALVLKLVSPGIWGQARGDFMLWRADSDEVSTMRVGPSYQLGVADPLLGLRFYVSRDPWLWLFGTIGVLFLLSGMAVWVLARRGRKRDDIS
jgi:cellulose synthase operon protein B